MGFFSWKTSDTNETIWNAYVSSGEMTFTVYMVIADGRTWKEEDYEGYGVFGGKDIYALIAEINGLADSDKDDEYNRHLGLDLVFKDNPRGDIDILEARGFKVPKLFRNKYSKFDEFLAPQTCQTQGYFLEGV